MTRDVFFFNDAATAEVYTLSLHDALPIYGPRSDRAWIEYTAVVDDSPSITGVRAFWVGVTDGCGVDPIFDVPGGGAPGEIHQESAGWTVPASGRIVMAGGHIHGGALNVKLQR